MAQKNKLEGRYVLFELPSGRKIRAPIFNDVEAGFVRRARRMFLKNCDWDEFEDFAFGYHRPGRKSPLYGARRKNYPDPIKDPLYIILREMWLTLGIKQGYIAESKTDKFQATQYSR